MEDNLSLCSGALKSPEDPRDWVFEGFAKGNYYLNVFPDEFDLRPYMLPCRDQGPRGTCAAFTACSIKELHVRMNTLDNEDVDNLSVHSDAKYRDEHMSPEFIYFHRDNKPASGMYGRNVFKILKKYGSVPETHFPYQARDIMIAPPSARLYNFASRYKISSYARVNTVNGLKRAILELGPAYFLLPLYDSRPEFWHNDGKCLGGHATTIVGFTQNGFILKNSWGDKWNGDGCIIFPYSDWNLHWECWIPINDSTQHKVPEEVQPNNDVCMDVCMDTSNNMGNDVRVDTDINTDINTDGSMSVDKPTYINTDKRGHLAGDKIAKGVLDNSNVEVVIEKFDDNPRRDSQIDIINTVSDINRRDKNGKNKCCVVL